VGDPSTFERILGSDECYRLTRFDDAFPSKNVSAAAKNVFLTRIHILKKIAEYVISNPKVIMPGIQVSIEILQNYYYGKCSIEK